MPITVKCPTDKLYRNITTDATVYICFKLQAEIITLFTFEKYFYQMKYKTVYFKSTNN